MGSTGRALLRACPLVRIPVLGLVLMAALGLPSCAVGTLLPEGQVLYKDSRVEWPEMDDPRADPPSVLGPGVADSEATAESEEENDRSKKELKRARKQARKQSQATAPDTPEDILGDLNRLDQRRANKRFLGLVPFRLWLYLQLTKNDEGPLESWVEEPGGIQPAKNLVEDLLYQDSTRSLRRWAIESIGEPPVLYDTTLAKERAEKLEAYLSNKGYFHAEVETEHEVRRKSGESIYTVDAGPRYYINRVRFMDLDSTLEPFLTEAHSRLLIIPGQPYDLDRFKAERVRVRDTLLNHGFYTFDRNYVEFAIDSTIGERLLDVYIRILQPLEDSAHERYKVGHVYTYPDYRPGAGAGTSGALELDTLERRGVEIIYRNLDYRPSTLLNAIYIRPDEYYVAAQHRRTQRRLTELGAFRFVSVQYQEREEAGQRYLDTYIRLQQAKKQNLSVEWNANTNFNALIGSDVDFNYRNRNLFRNADLFTLNLSTGVETQFAEDENLLRNLDFSGSANLAIPKLLLPKVLRPSRARMKEVRSPRTIFEARYIYTRRLAFYTLHSTAFGLGYSWRQDEHQAHSIRPIDITLVVPTELTDSFQAVLDGNFLLQQSFQSTIIPAASYSYVYARQNLQGGRQGVVFQGSGELAGNLINLGWSAVENGEHTIGGINLAQYARATADARYYWRFNAEQSIATRALVGIGVPYGNSDALPFVRQFFAGGPSSVRAWRVRRLGPGSFSVEDTTQAQRAFVDQTGDLHLELNFEYRFPIYQFLEGAFFVDAGNIWLLNEDPERPGGKIRSDFYRDIAIGTGIGLRLDFDFFLVRADMGFRVRDPSLRGRDAWLMRDPGSYLDNFNQVTEFNIAIGYPF